MTKYDCKTKFADAILKLCPNSPELKWDRATLTERRGHTSLLKERPDEAIALYREAIDEKRKLLNQFKINMAEWNKKRCQLAQSCLLCAKICRSLERYGEARKSLTFLIDVLNEEKFPSGEQVRVLALLQEGYRLMADILPQIFARNGLITTS